MRGRGAGTPNVTAVQHADASVAIGCHSQAIIRLVGARRLRPYMRVTAQCSATLLTRPHAGRWSPKIKRPRQNARAGKAGQADTDIVVLDSQERNDEGV